MNIALIFAGGTGIRMNSKTKPKQFLRLHGKTIIMHTIEHFENHDEIDEIVVVCIENWIDELKREMRNYGIRKVAGIVVGGSTVQESIYNGLIFINKKIARLHENEKNKNIVLIHDGVRPLINADLISANISAVKEFGSAVTVARECETVSIVDENNNIYDIKERETVRIAKAPQSFFLDMITQVHERAKIDHVEGVIDSASLMNNYGYKLHTILGPEYNIKVTTATDFYIFRALLDAKENSQIFG